MAAEPDIVTFGRTPPWANTTAASATEHANAATIRWRSTSSIMPEAFARRTLVAAIVAVLATAVPPAAAQREAAPTPDIHYVPTSGGVTDAMLKLAKVTPNDVVYDLGSGDGRIVIAAAKKYGARGVGIELDPKLIKTATKNALKAGVADKVTFLQADLFKTDFSDATVVTLYLSNSINRRLASILQRQLKPGARIVSHRFDMGDWKPEADVRLEGTHVYLWTIGPPER
jgi:SAM-dependent methyltransferase